MLLDMTDLRMCNSIFLCNNIILLKKILTKYEKNHLYCTKEPAYNKSRN